MRRADNASTMLGETTLERTAPNDGGRIFHRSRAVRLERRDLRPQRAIVQPPLCEESTKRRRAGAARGTPLIPSIVKCSCEHGRPDDLLKMTENCCYRRGSRWRERAGGQTPRPLSAPIRHLPRDARVYLMLSELERARHLVRLTLIYSY